MSDYSNYDHNKKLTPFARALRKDASPGEKKLWREVLSDGKMLGYRFRRQRPIDKYIADFFCKELFLLIEVDGICHDWQGEKDAKRDSDLAALGYEILRVSHYQVITDIVNVSRSIEGKILQIIGERELKPKQ